MKSYVIRFAIVLLASLVQMLFLPAILNMNGYVTVIILIIFSYDSTPEELMGYSFLSGFFVGAMSGSDMFLHLFSHLVIGGLLLALKKQNVLPSKHRTRIWLLLLLTVIYTFVIIVPVEIDITWWLQQSGWNSVITTAIYMLLLPLFSRIIKREQHTLFYG